MPQMSPYAKGAAYAGLALVTPIKRGGAGATP